MARVDGVAAFLLITAAVLLAACRRGDTVIRVDVPTDAEVVVGIHAADGKLVRELSSSEGGPGEGRQIVWDGLDNAGEAVKPGLYSWSGYVHHRFSTAISGAACVLEPPEAIPSREEPNPWGGSGGVPSAVTADQMQVYLGWSGGQVTACDLDGHIVWSVALPDGAECRALAVDSGTIVALARSRPPRPPGDFIAKLNVQTGALAEWPSDRTLPITALWPENADAKPAHADALAARSGRIYLTFSELQFLAVLRTDTGAYLQTVVGPPPGCLDVTPTKTELPDAPGKLVDADFAMVALQGGVLGKVLFAHDPLWVILSDLQPLDHDERITALALLGDVAPHHRHSVFVGLDAPFYQVQRRSVLNSEGFLWIAGLAGGRPAAGPWNPDALARVNAVALDARGRLWIAEGDAVPPRFSVWDTEGNQGRIERELFGPVRPEDTGAAVLPDDPEILVGAGCEWRVDPHGGPAKCLGVITRDGMVAAGFRRSKSGALLLHVQHSDGTVSVFERRGEGDYEPRDQHSSAAELKFARVTGLTVQESGVRVTLTDSVADSWLVKTSDGLTLDFAKARPALINGVAFEKPLEDATTVAQSSDGRVYRAVASHGLFRVEISGLDRIRRLPGGKLNLHTTAKPQSSR